MTDETLTQHLATALALLEEGGPTGYLELAEGWPKRDQATLWVALTKSGLVRSTGFAEAARGRTGPPLFGLTPRGRSTLRAMNP